MDCFNCNGKLTCTIKIEDSEKDCPLRRSMEAKELREKIDHILYLFNTNKIGYTEARERFLALINEALPELARKVGYVKLAEDQSLSDNVYQVPLKQFLTANGWRRVEEKHES